MLLSTLTAASARREALLDLATARQLAYMSTSFSPCEGTTWVCVDTLSERQTGLRVCALCVADARTLEDGTRHSDPLCDLSSTCYILAIASSSLQ